MSNEENREEKISVNRARRGKLTPTDIGKIPPQALDLEQSVLGAMMLDSGAVNNVIDILRTKDAFYDPKHQIIFDAIAELFKSTTPIDVLTVTEQLRKMGSLEIAGGAYYLSTLTNKIASSAHIEHHSRVIIEKFIQREIIGISNELLRESYDETKDVFEILAKAEEELFAVAQNNMKKSYDTMQTAMKGAIEEIENARKNKDGVSGVPSGFKDLDKITAGWQRSDMVVIAARPGMGKTAFVLSMARNTAVEYNMGVAIFSLEMSSVQLVKRLIASETEVDAEKLRRGNIADHELQQIHSKIAKLSKAPIYIDDTPGISIFELRAKCRRMKQKHDIQIIIIDYLQLMTSGTGKSFGNREQEISQISRSIKEIAKELNVPVIALSQLSRSVEQRGGDKKPVLSDLRESGAIEQDADIVAFIYRGEYYGFTEDDKGPTTGTGDIIIAKHRNGSTGSVRLQFIGKYARFSNFESYRFEEELQTSNTLPMGNSFDSEGPQAIIRSSRMDDIDVNFDDDFNTSGNEFEDDPF
ncbi:MAG: replicative DNA helicase [Brumimicrobium sp.]|nr:replicative DNA helicase [Brumimicrobium sp.]